VAYGTAARSCGMSRSRWGLAKRWRWLANPVAGNRPSRARLPVCWHRWRATRYEFKELMDIGGVQVAQPDVGWVGGLSEGRIVCDMAAARGVTIVPHCWKTGISISATAHLAFATAHYAYID
jgi:L-alanine-DL-glutamate epimerase-like enolase superfamily enzyme